MRKSLMGRPVLPTRADRDMRLRVVSRPESALAVPLGRLHLRLPHQLFGVWSVSINRPSWRWGH